MKRNTQPRMLTYVLISALIFLLSLAVSIVTRMALVADCRFMAFSEDQAGLVTGIIEGVVAAIAAGLVLYQLKLGSNVEEHQNSIEEAQFILQYNQAFIQDEKICNIEHLLERTMLHEISGPIIHEGNRQLLINYLVYLEGLAPLILADVLQLEHVDDLFAYRFFLAINNREVQQDQLFAFPDYYRGCFKVYEKWTRYRKSLHRQILQEENSLDKWDRYEMYIDSPVTVRRMTEADDARVVAGLIFQTDPYIYPAAFGSARRARRVLPRLMEQPHTLFCRDNLIVAAVSDCVVGVAVVADSPRIQPYSPGFRHPALPGTFAHTRDHYFNKIEGYFQPGEVYVACVAVDSKQRGRRIGQMLIKFILREYAGRRIRLHVLADNSAAISLYEKYGFRRVGRPQAGYSIQPPPPLCYEMVREAAQV